MKKLLGILVLGLLWCNVSAAGTFDKYQLMCRQPMFAENIFNGSLAKEFYYNFLIKPDKKIFNSNDEFKVKSFLNAWGNEILGTSKNKSTNLYVSAFNQDISNNIDLNSVQYDPKISNVYYSIIPENKKGDIRGLTLIWTSMEKKNMRVSIEEYTEKDMFIINFLQLDYQSPLDLTFGFTSLIGKQYDQLLDLNNKLIDLYKNKKKNQKKIDKLQNKKIKLFFKIQKKNTKKEEGPLGYSSVGDFTEINCKGNFLNRLTKDALDVHKINLRTF